MAQPITVEQMWSWVEHEISTDLIMDIKFKDYPLKRFKLHKMVLLKSSQTFANLFETSRSGGTKIKIKDCKPHIMEIALRHLYGCKLTNETLDYSDMKDLVIVADKYHIVTLKEACAKYICKNLIIPENVLGLINLRYYFQGTSYTDFIEIQLYTVLQEQTAECISQDYMFNLSEADVLILILNLDECNLKSELDLIRFVDYWASVTIKKHQENITLVDEYKIRKLIEPRILPLIRFLTLTKREFNELCTCFNWLSRDEKLLIIQGICDKKIPEDFPPYLSSSKINRCNNVGIQL